MNSLLTSWHPRLVALANAASGMDGAHDTNHLHRVWRNASLLLDDYPEADALVVLAGCYLHDLVNLPKDDPERHLASRKAALLASRQLAELDFPPNKLAAVAHAIESHSFSAGIRAETIEARIVQDADRLDALGAVGLARLFYTAGRMNSALAHPDDPMALHRDLNDKAYALDHIDTKLATLPGKMQTSSGRRLAETRLKELIAFRDTFIAEWAASPATP
ncbi:HD domain-containing protein [Duganella sp. FT80W]|uniref:HD domain-containing protein n=1 Tax=Duganella guangzhouensis TaxID=2666084 RepID=A0A6I2KWH7_9BURK|nr:HD domain-containing protein [Duganella guangzhouensis]MRW88764.1 HD domain-containing protein [Duganella guangzhouensis]